MRMNWKRGLFAATAGLCASTAGAEVLPVSGIYPAGTDKAIGVETIAIESFTGSHGPSLEFDIKDKLEAVRIEGEAWFYVVPTVGDDVQAVMRGSASHESFEERIESKEVTKCIKKDENKKCIARRTSYIPCRKLTVRLFPDIRLTAINGQELYSYSSQQTIEKKFCEDDSKVPSVNGLLAPLRNRVTYSMRRALAPVERNEEIRVLESRKNLEKADRKPFKAAVKLTKTDIVAACEGFQALEANNPSHVSVLFNIGLCHEGEGDLETAAAYYDRALAAEPDKDAPQAGLKRIARRERADLQLAMREERLGDSTSELAEIDELAEDIEPGIADDAAGAPGGS